MKFYFRGYHWPHILFFGLTPLLAIAGVVWRLFDGGIPGATWILAVSMLALCGLSTTAGYHRLFSHRSYRAAWPARLFYLLFGAGAFQGSVRWWCCEHRYHHLYTDTERDPYGINKGFWYAHLGWLFTKDQDPSDYSNVKDLDEDPLVRWQARFFPWLAVLMGYGLPALVASLWGDPWGGFLVAGLARMVVNHHTTFCINSVCHYVGSQPYSDSHSARDSWIAALLTYGEGYHNFHHEFQYDYRNGIRFFHWDPSKWLIVFLKWMGMVTQLRQARQEHILQARLLMEQKRVERHLLTYSESVQIKAREILTTAGKHLQETYARFQALKQDYQRIKQDQMASLTTSVEEYRRQLRSAQQEFQQAMAAWRTIIRGPALFFSDGAR